MINVFRENKTLAKNSASIGRITHTSSEDLRPASLVSAFAAHKQSKDVKQGYGKTDMQLVPLDSCV